jgi:hypothetical protein
MLLTRWKCLYLPQLHQTMVIMAPSIFLCPRDRPLATSWA